MALITPHHILRKPRLRAGAAVVAVGLMLAGCSLTDAKPDAAGTARGTVVLVTHDSFAVDPHVLAAFEAASGLKVKQVAPGDGGALVN